MASIYLPPIARKKKVDGWPRQDTARVFPDLQADAEQEGSNYRSHFIRHNVPPTKQRLTSANRKNNPQPKTVTFLRQNPRFVCEPICHVGTRLEGAETLHSWWPNETIPRPITTPQYTFNSTSRADYKNFSQYISPCPAYSRYEVLGQNTPKPHAVMGIVPGYRISENAPRISEKISYEHQLDSRRDPSHPIRGRRHGCFVWKVVTPARKHEKLEKMNSNERKDVVYELANIESNDEDANSVVSTISAKPEEIDEEKLNQDETFEHFEPHIKNDAWISPRATCTNQRLLKVIKQPEKLSPPDDLFDMAESELEEMIIKPSRPRRRSPPHAV